MDNLAKRRLAENTKRNLRYLRLVFNDFFVLALIFLFGGFMYWYAQSLPKIPNNLWFYKPILAMAFTVGLIPGELVTLIKKADLQFLFVKDSEMTVYLQNLKKYSLILPYIILTLLIGIAFPFAGIKLGMQFWEYLIIAVLLYLLKAIYLQLEYLSLSFQYHYSKVLFYLIAFLGIYASLLDFAASVALLIALIGFTIYIFSQKLESFDWTKAYEKERIRQNRVFIFYSMFTDVSEKAIVIKRRKYLDFLLNFQKAKNANQFLLQRNLLRNPDYISLLVRMTIFAILLSFMVTDMNMVLILSALVVFLTAYQLLPIKRLYQRHIMYHVMPIKRDNIREVKSVVIWALLLQVIMIVIFWIVIFKISVLLNAAILLIFMLLIANIYLPLKLKKKN